jgi:hypothetical protein
VSWSVGLYVHNRINACMHAMCSMVCLVSMLSYIQVWDIVWQLAPSCNTAHLTMSVGVLG